MTIDLDAVVLKHGSHRSPEDGMCAMEVASYLAGEEFSDHPLCVSLVIASFMRGLNDSWDDTTRQLLKPYISKVLNTAAGERVELRRSQLAIDWLVRFYTPAWLETAGLSDDAKALRERPEITDLSIAEVQAVLQVARDKANAAENAAKNAAWDAAGNAVENAAKNAAWDAAWDAAKNAAWDAAENAVENAAENAAWDAAWDAAENAAKNAAENAAENAAKEKLKPTVAALQQSALELIDRMIAVRVTQ